MLEIARIVEMGVTIKCNCEVGNALSVEQLKAEYRAVLVTVGMSYGSTLPLFERANHVEIAVDFLQRARQSNGDITVRTKCINHRRWRRGDGCRQYVEAAGLPVSHLCRA